MKLKIYQVDAFTEKVFSGNPAYIVIEVITININENIFEFIISPRLF